MRPSHLFFPFESITDIKWIPGSPVCVVTWADDALVEHIVQVDIADLDVLRPSLKRMLLCAAASVDPREDDRPLWFFIKKWHTFLSGRTAKNFLFAGASLRAFSEINSVVLPTPGAAYRPHQNEFLLGCIRGSTSAFTAAVMDANIPGIVAGCAVLRENYSVAALDALNLMISLAQRVPYSVMETETDNVLRILRSCVMVGATADEMGALLAGSIGVTTVPADLPALAW